MTKRQGYKPSEVLARVPGLTRRRLLYLHNKDMWRAEHMYGRYRQWSKYDVAMLRLLSDLRKKGYTIHTAVHYLKRADSLFKRALNLSSENPSFPPRSAIEAKTLFYIHKDLVIMLSQGFACYEPQDKSRLFRLRWPT